MVAIETPRLLLRHLTPDDVGDLAVIYADPIVMKFFPGTRSYEETRLRLEQTIAAYAQQGFGLWATIHKADNKLIGRCGLIAQVVDGQPEVEVGYMLAKEYWNKGLATEAARASRDFGFENLGCDRLISLIDPHNVASQKVALKNGMTYEKDTNKWAKTLRVYSISRQ